MPYIRHQWGVMLWMQKEGPQLETWEQCEDQGNMNGTSEWLCTRTIDLKQLVKNNEMRELLILREKCGTLLITDNYGQVYTNRSRNGDDGEDSGLAFQEIHVPRGFHAPGD